MRGEVRAGSTEDGSAGSGGTEGNPDGRMEHMVRKKARETGDRRPSARGGGRPPVGSMRDLLSGGDLRSIGRVSGTPAMRACGRKLLSLLKEEINVL